MYRGPEELNALEEAEEQRGIAQGSQGAADVGNQEDEEDNGVDFVLAVRVCTEQGADEQHGRAGGTHPTGQDRTHQKNAEVDHWLAHQLAGETNTSGNCEQCEEQYYEWYVFKEQGVHDFVQGQGEAVLGW